MARKGYNGHPSWAAWNVSLWLNNDEGTYRAMRRCIRYTRNRDEAAAMMLAGARYTISNIKHAMVGL